MKPFKFKEIIVPELPRYMAVYILESELDFRKKRLIEGGARPITYDDPEKDRSNVQAMRDQLVVSKIHIVRPYWATHEESYKMYPTQLERLASYSYVTTAGIPVYNTGNNSNTQHLQNVFKTVEGYLTVGERHSSRYDMMSIMDIPLRSALQKIANNEASPHKRSRMKDGEEMSLKSCGMFAYEPNSEGNPKTYFDAGYEKKERNDVVLKCLNAELGLYKFKKVTPDAHLNSAGINSPWTYIQVRMIF